jgi:hypothetical protein
MLRMALSGTLLGFSLAGLIIIIGGWQGISLVIALLLSWVGGFLVGAYVAYVQWANVYFYEQRLFPYLINKFYKKQQK